MPDFDTALTAAPLALEFGLLLLIAIEWRRDRIRRPFPILLGYYVIMHLTLTPVAKSSSFQAFSIWFAGI